ncbi:MAG: hypothetical protein HN334_02260 [Candidatus Cloacimonetes bacterium]|nr:hypothetical protein [Candidatus Cloacimonadota bacterium]
MKELNRLEQDYFYLRYLANKKAPKQCELLKELKITKKQLEKLKDTFDEFHTQYKQYYNENRKKLFKDPVKFMNWFTDQNNKCGYCGITSKELKQIAKDRGTTDKPNLTLNGKTKRSKGTLEIERTDSKEEYSLNNVILACPLCNNAKSNLIDEDGWKDFFVCAMKSYYKRLLSKNEQSNNSIGETI